MLNRSAIIRYAQACDASMYFLVPEAVAAPETLIDIKELLRYARENRKSLTFRAAGTSLSGQSVTSEILVNLVNHWKKFEISESGCYITSQPGVIAGRINKALSKYGRKLGPDPASINSCMIGGIVANNSSGMRSGTDKTPYKTVKTLEFTLANGVTINSAEQNAGKVLFDKSPDIHNGLELLRNEIVSDIELTNRIISKYKIKNTIGYQLNSFIDYTEPLDILAHLLIGSEGTLGFISEAVFETFPDYSNKLTALLFFNDMHTACNAIKPLIELGVSALEIIDRTSLASIERQDGVPIFIKNLPNSVAALLIEFQEETVLILDKKELELKKFLATCKLLATPNITRDPDKQTLLWKVRQGLLPSLGKARNPGNSFIIEDVAFRIEDIAEAISHLQKLFLKFGYSQTGIYGHGIDGNLHFMLAPALEKPVEKEKFSQFMNELTTLVVRKFDGSLKAEHGTGRNMAPFVELEWGSKAYSIMKKIKSLLDPLNILNPGVILNADPKIHIKNIKQLPAMNNIADKCIECGFCEPVCPSRELTLTPRRRISINRQIAINDFANEEEANELLNEFRYYSLDTCAVDGLCGSACPLGINTGDLTKELRSKSVTEFGNTLALEVVNKIAPALGIASFGVSAVNFARHLLGTSAVNFVSEKISKNIRSNFYKWSKFIGSPARITPANISAYDAVYFPCCMSKVFGAPATNYSKHSSLNIIEAFLEISRRANIKLKIPKDCGEFCCGMAFSSKGYSEAYSQSANLLIEAMYEWSMGGRAPIVADSSSCAYTVKTCEDALSQSNLTKWRKLKVLDSVEYLYDSLSTSLRIKSKQTAIAVHPTCSLRKMGLEHKFKLLAEKFSEYVYYPENPECCGFAGDRGLLFPELTASSAGREAYQIKKQEIDFSGYYSNNISCEIGMSEAVGKAFLPIVYLLLDCT